jgi:DsbC/DsbD-like thiol-disulfide interchange protein
LNLETETDWMPFRVTMPAASLVGLLRGFLFLLPALTLSGSAVAARSDWAQADHSELRLLLTEGQDGSTLGGVEIVLEPGWYTYWRNPGEAGIPPRFDFSASENVAAVEVLYPAPVRYDDGVSVSAVYNDEVVFPLAVTPENPAQPMRLSVAAEFGVCRDVCIPTYAENSVELPLQPDPDPLAEARLQSFVNRLPGPAEPGHFDVESLAAEGSALLVDVRMPESTYADLFVDPPAGWYVKQPDFVSRADGVSRYRIEVDDRPAGTAGLEFRFLAVAGGEAIEENVVLP